jgi:hypothetical protein
MKKVIKLSEEKLGKIISQIMEQVNLEDYADEDFIEGFLITFRQWITEKLGDESKKYPLSYLLKKYGIDFEKEMGIHVGYGDSSSFSHYRLLRSGKSLAEKEKYSLPSMNPGVKFTEKYSKLLSHFIDKIELPDFVSISMEETVPNKVDVRFDVDFPKMIVSPEFKSLSSGNLLFNLKKYLENFGGVEFGNPNYGQVQMNGKKLNYVGMDEWVKNVLNKKIKKEIKSLVPYAKNIHSIRFDVEGGKANMKIVFKDDFRWNLRKEVVSGIREYLTNLGYNTDVLRVDS